MFNIVMLEFINFRLTGIKLEFEINIENYDFEYSLDEINILKKLSEWPKCIDISCRNLEPHRIPTYLYELASLFHSYWNLGKIIHKKDLLIIREKFRMTN